MPDPQPGQPEPSVPASGGADDGAPPDQDALAALREEVTLLIEDARTYAEAEIAFQKTRAAIVGQTASRALVRLVLALVLLHIALIALAVGAVIALAPLVGVWGAIAVVVGVLLAGVAWLVLGAKDDGTLLAALFASDGSKDA